MNKATGLTILDRCLLAVGVLCIAAYAGVLMYRSLSSRAAIREFDRAHASVQPVRIEEPPTTDFTLWSDKRLQTYRESRSVQKGSPLAILTVARLNIRAAIFEGTDEWALNRGLGWIAGTASPGQPGNVGIAGHRDGFFRALKDVSIGERIELLTQAGAMVYSVDKIEIVNPDDVGVLRPRATSSLTLVTCYPFYFIGDAPQRFIVHAALRSSEDDRGETRK